MSLFLQQIKVGKTNSLSLLFFIEIKDLFFLAMLDNFVGT